MGTLIGPSGSPPGISRGRSRETTSGPPARAMSLPRAASRSARGMVMTMNTALWSARVAKSLLISIHPDMRPRGLPLAVSAPAARVF
eukprot:8771072-Pyramimonas_sp.AAC.1